MIEFLPLQQVNAPHREALLGALTRVLDSGWYVLGAETEAFEAEFAAYCGAAHCVGVANGLTPCSWCCAPGAWARATR
jgi:dTDP-4-amino-4,6-dideoxygalactose transaminase